MSDRKHRKNIASNATNSDCPQDSENTGHESTAAPGAGAGAGDDGGVAEENAASDGNGPCAAEVKGNDKRAAEGKENDQPTPEELDQIKKELESARLELENRARQCAEYFDRLQRTAAEFDNYKKRSQKEKEALYADAVSDVVGAFIPVIDSIERALGTVLGSGADQPVRDGIEMIYRQFKDILRSIGVEEIKTVGESFDPNLHDAVMHVEDESYGSNTIVEEFRKGYIYKDRVIRHSMVKVAN